MYSYVNCALCVFQGQFIYENESPAHLSERDRHGIYYDTKLTHSIILMYSPVACDTHICLDSTPTGNQTLFVHAPHAMMIGEVKAVITHSIHSTLHSLGGIQVVQCFVHKPLLNLCEMLT